MLQVFVCESLKITFILAFLPVLREHSLLNLYLFEETFTALKSPVRSEDNGLGANFVHLSICKLPLYN